MSTKRLGVREKFRLAGHSLTPQRQAVLDALKGFKGHPSATAIYLAVKRRQPRVALGTVYQALSVLEEIGLVKAKRWPDSAVRYDRNVEPHCDIRCTRCERVEEVPGMEYKDFAVRLQENTFYKVTNAAPLVEGICPDCQAEGQN